MAMQFMMFVDGENFTIRAQEYAQNQGKSLPEPHLPDVFWWGTSAQSCLQDVMLRHGLRGERYRRYYYTCITGNDGILASTHDKIQEHDFAPVVVKKVKGMRAKGVDISLTKDMLVHAFSKNYETAILVAGDGDYVPLVEEVKRFGREVVLMFFDEANGLNPQLRRAADVYYELMPQLG